MILQKVVRLMQKREKGLWSQPLIPEMTHEIIGTESRDFVNSNALNQDLLDALQSKAFSTIEPNFREIDYDEGGAGLSGR